MHATTSTTGNHLNENTLLQTSHHLIPTAKGHHLSLFLTLAGNRTLTRGNNSDDISDATSKYTATEKNKKPFILLCHGVLNNANSKLLRALEEQLLPSINVARLDFRGNGYSGGTTAYDNYHEEAQDIHTIIEWMHQHNYPVTAILGHSKAASVVLIWAATYLNLMGHPVQQPPRLIMLAPRYDHNAEPKSRWSTEQLKDLEEKGELVWMSYNHRSNILDNDGDSQKPYVITKEQFRKRKLIDMSVVCDTIVKKNCEVCQIYQNQRQVHEQCNHPLRYLIIHGKSDETIPYKDSEMYQEKLSVCHCAVPNSSPSHSQHTSQNPVCQLTLIDGADHGFRSTESVQSVANAVKHFLQL